MIISRAPYRISFAGGGTDLKSFYELSHGLTVSTSINKYIYIIVKKPKNLIEKKYKINMGKVQHTHNINLIKHPIVRETLRLLKIDHPIEIGMYSDMPSKSGLGSSSTFTVALIKALYELNNKKISNYKLAELAAKIEIDILKRNIGKQDHYASVFGGINKIKYLNNGKVIVQRINISKNLKKRMLCNLHLYFTGVTRDASKILKYQNNNVEKIIDNLIKIRNLVKEFEDCLKNKQINKIGEILKKNWDLKKKISNPITSPALNKIFNSAISNGASGGKILGAGGGGFFLFYVNKKNKTKFLKSLKNLIKIEFDFDENGAKIIFNDNLD